MSTEREDLEIRSEEVQEILGDVPHWLIRWGITSLFVVLILVLTGSWFIKYPDVVSAQVILTTEDPPVKIISRFSGRLSLFIDDREHVEVGQFLGVLENTATASDMLRLIRFLEVSEGNNKPFEGLSIPLGLQLGVLQSTYQQWLSALEQKQLFDQLDRHGQQIESLEKRIVDYEKLKDQLMYQLTLEEKEVELAKRNAERDSILYLKKIETVLKWENSKASYLQKQRGFESTKTSITNNSIQISDLKAQLNDQKLDQVEQKSKLNIQINQAFRALESSVKDWKQQFLLESPVSGQVTFIQYWRDGQFVNTGDVVMVVVPESETYHARLILPMTSSGKVRPGNRVIIRFDNYPETEYGTIVGIVDQISLVPRDNTYLVNVLLPEGLNTTYGQQLEFRQEMRGQADIVTNELKLFERIFNNLRKLLNQ